MANIIEAVARIRGEDATGAAFASVAKKLAEIGKGAKVSAEVSKLSKELQSLDKGAKAAQAVRDAMASFAGARTSFRTAQADVAGIAKALDSARKAAAQFDGVKAFAKGGGIAKEAAAARKEVADLEQALFKAQRTVRGAASAYEAQAAAVKAMRRSAIESGVDTGRLVAEQTRLKGSVEDTTAALLKQARSQARAREAKDLTIEHRQAAAARRASIAQEIAERHEARQGARRDAVHTIAAGAGVYAAHKGKQIGMEAVKSAAEFDLATRKQKVFTDISDADQGRLLAQAKQVGQETQFSNIDVVKAQTAAMQGLPSGFAPSLKAEVAEGIIANVRNFATLMETDLKDGTEIIRGYLQQSGKDISTKEKALAEANKATNQLVKMAKLGGMDGEDVKNFANYAISSATASGLSTEATMSLGALARRGGLRGDVAGVAVRSMAGKIVSPTQKGLTALNAAGIKYSDFVRMPDRLSTDALEGQFQMKMGKGFTPAIRKRVDAINGDKDLIGDQGRYTEAVVKAVGDMLGKTKKGKVKASDAKVAAKATGDFYRVSGSSVDAEGLLDAAMSKNMTLPQLNAWLTDKHGGKGAITQRQWDEFKASREQIKKAGDDPDWAKKKADEVYAGLGGSIENLKGSFENLVLQIGLANAGLVKFTADGLGKGIDAFSNLSQTSQQLLTLAGGGAALAGGAAGVFKLTQSLLGIGGGAAALTGSAAALDSSAAALTAAALKLGGGGVVTEAGKKVAESATGGAAATGGASVAGRVLGGVARGAGIAAPIMILRELGEAHRPMTPEGAPYRLDQAIDPGTWERADRGRKEFQRDPEGKRARDNADRIREAASSGRSVGPAPIPPSMTWQPTPGAPIEAKVMPDQIQAKLDGRVPVDVTGKLEPVKLEGQGVIVVQAAPGTQVLSAFGSGHIRVEGGGSSGRSMPGATQSNPRPPGGV